MKKFIALLLVTSMLSCTACGDKTSESESSVKDSSGSTSVAEDSGQQEDSVSEIAEESENEEKTDEKRFYNFHNLSVVSPKELILYGFRDYVIWGKEDETADALYYAVIYRGLVYSDYNDPSTYGSDDAWEILSNELEDNIGCVYHDIAEFYDAEVETTEKFDFMGTEFVHSTGVVPFRKYDDAGGETVNIYYSACYGVIDFPAAEFQMEGKSVPIMWIAFSDSDSDDIKAEMDKIVDDTAKNASWVSESE